MSELTAPSIRLTYAFTVRSWAFYRSWLLTLILRILMFYEGFTVCAPIWTLAFILNLFGVLVRYNRVYFPGENADLWRFAHVSQAICVRSKFLQISSVLGPKARILTSSINLITLVRFLLLLYTFRRSAL
jgi:hypothetical protein